MQQSLIREVSKQRILELGFIVLLANGVVLAQGSKTDISTPTPNSATPINSKTNLEQIKLLRTEQLRTFQDHILTRTLDSLKTVDEPALRLAARNQILTYLSRVNPPSKEGRTIATSVALDALTDLSKHGDEIPPSMNYLWSDLAVWIEKYEPKLSEKFQGAKEMHNKQSNDIRALLELRGGDTLAAQRMGNILDEGRDIDGLVFYLDYLRERNSKELEPLLSRIVAVAERGPIPGLQTLYWVTHIYLHPQVPKTIKQRFLSMVIKRTQPGNLIGESTTKIAYDWLTQVLPAIRELIPESYEQALTQSFAMRASFSERELATEARAKRLRESLNPIEDLLAEAEAARSKAERNELLAEAAQWALQEKKLSLCLDTVAKLDLDVAGIRPDFWRNWSDQFLQDLVKAGLVAKDSELAEKGAGRITSPLVRVEGLNMIMLYLGKATDRTGARRLLTEASKIADTASDNVEKANAFFLLSITCDWADESQKTPLLESGIRAVNNVSKPDSGRNDKELYQQYVRSLDIARYQLTKSFRGLTKKDENGALAQIEKVQKSDLRPFAMIGILQGLDELLRLEQK